MNTKGFTLIEVLVVAGLVIIIATVAGNVFYSTMRSSTKTSLSTDLKQKGNYALKTMERMVRQAQDIVCDDSDNEITLTYLDNEQTTFSCDSDQIASNSAHSAVLVEGVDCTSFNIDCSLPQVGIFFSLTTGETNSLPFQKASLDFQTKVTVRNY